MKVLIVDDSPGSPDLLGRVVTARGHEAACFSDAALALEAFRRDTHPLIVVDGATPRVNGLEFCRAIRALPDGDTPFILMVTNRSGPEDLREALANGANDYIVKPLDPALLDLRLSIAEQQIPSLGENRLAKVRLQKTLSEMETSRDDMSSILDHIRIGTALTDESGRMTFLSRAAQGLFEHTPEEVVGKPWREAFPFKPQDIDRIGEMARRPPAARTKLPVHLRTPGGRYYWVEIEVQDDPRAGQRKIFLFYDTTEIHDLRRMVDNKAQFQDLVGKSKPMMRVYQQIQELAAVETTVLITGETGTGKELVARALHSCSQRQTKPFLAINCAGLSESLLASQLFGHRRGAFTGALGDHKGVFEEADGGTLFLDEIGEISVNVQTSLLRVLQEKEITRVGENMPRKVDVRIIAATNRDLGEEVAKGRFRADLMYRIRVACISLPPLRERREDVPLLAGVFLNRFRAASGKQVQDISGDAMASLMEHPWPGNVRELENTVEVAAVRCKGAVIHTADLPPEILHQGQGSPPGESQPAAVRRPGANKQETRILDALRDTGGNRKEAARLLGISRATLYRHLQKFGITTEA